MADAEREVPDSDAFTNPERLEAYRAIAEEVTAQSAARVMEQFPDMKPAEGDTMLLFATVELPGGRGAFRQVLADLEPYKDSVKVLLRGLPLGERRIDGAAKALAALISNPSETPAVEIDPGRFKEFGIDAAPVLVYLRDGQEIARASGTANVEWLQEQVRYGRRGNLGVVGDLVEIAEQDILEDIQQRLAQIDLNAKKREAMGRFWSKVQFVELPEAREAAAFELDPTIEVTEDILTPDGQVIAQRGDRVNPLAERAFTKRIIVFDAGSPKQTAYAKKLGAEARAQGKSPVYMVTALAGEPSFEALGALEDAMADRVFLLTTQVVERFQLRAVPSTVEARKAHFLIQERPVPADALPSARPTATSR